MTEYVEFRSADWEYFTAEGYNTIAVSLDIAIMVK